MPKGLLLVKLIEPPYTERYVRWCERSEGEIIAFLLLDFFLTVNLPDVPESWIIAAEQGFTKGVDCYDVI